MNLREAIEKISLGKKKNKTPGSIVEVVPIKCLPWRQSKERNGKKYNEHLVSVKYCVWCWGPRSETNSPITQAV